jgi:hypothetical protein
MTVGFFGFVARWLDGLSAACILTSTTAPFARGSAPPPNTVVAIIATPATAASEAAPATIHFLRI